MGLLYFKETLKYFLRSRLFISKYVKEVERLYGMSPEELRARNEKRFLEIFRLAYTKSPFYSKLYKEHGIALSDIKTLADIKKLPVVSKEMIREHPEQLLTCPKWLTWKNHTSGTTGTPLVIYESWNSIWRNQADMCCYRKYCDFSVGKDKIASMRGHLNRSETTLIVDVSKTLYLSSFNLSKNTIEEYYNQLKRFKPKAIEGYPSTLFSLCLLLKTNQLSIKIPIIFTSSETLGYGQRIFIETILGGTVFDHYGNTERTISLSERKDHSGYFERPGCSINEYFGNEIITTSLINKSFPLIRYKVDDLLTLNDEVKKEPLDPIVKSVNGRASISITGKDGTKYNAAALTYLAKSIPNIFTVQLVQEGSCGLLNINIIPKDIFSEKDQELTKKAIDEKIGLDNIDYQINVITPQELIYSKNGKLSLIVILSKGEIV